MIDENNLFANSEVINNIEKSYNCFNRYKNNTNILN